MSDWTFGAVKARNMAVEAYCQNAACRRFYVFDLDYLIAEMGAEYLVSDIPQLDCQACGSPMEIKLAFPGTGRVRSGLARIGRLKTNGIKTPHPARSAPTSPRGGGMGVR